MGAARRQPRLEQFMTYCRRVFDERGHAPSYSMIRDELPFCSDDGTVRHYVKRAEAAGLITLDGYTGGRGPRRGQRIRLGRPEEADTVKIKMGRDL